MTDPFVLAAALVQALGWCLVHFLWQGVLLGVIYALARRLLPRGNARYCAAMLALLVLAVMPAWTFWYEVGAITRPLPLGDMVVVGVPGVAASVPGLSPHRWPQLLGAAMPWLVLVWACGVAFLGVRVVRQWRRLQAIVRAAEALPVWQARAELLSRNLGLRHVVKVLASVRIATPTLVGWVRPVVVMPLAVLARMPAEQVDLILAHELAHLRRLDHLANLFQVWLEVLFFFHPVVHWVSRDARNERELCCDALALRVSGGRRRDFVEALAGLEEFRAGHSDLALAASGGVLVERAWFVAGMTPPQSRSRGRGAALALGLLAVLVALAAMWRHDATQLDLAPQPLAMVRILAPRLALTLPARLQVYLPPAPLSPVHATALAMTAVSSEIKPATERLEIADIATANMILPAVAMQDVETAHAAEAPITTQVAAPQAVVAGPKPLRVVAPAYPDGAFQNGVSGTVAVAFTLDAHGRPAHLEVLSSTPGDVFDAAAVRALAQWRFAPPATPGKRYRQVFSFTPDAASGASVMAALPGCTHVTGTHICRQPDDAGNGVQTLASPKP